MKKQVTRARQRTKTGAIISKAVSTPQMDAPQTAVALRRQADVTLIERKKTASLPTDKADIRKLFHELRVHQIELEMQNEELMRARVELETLLRQYADLYDFAPVGYFTLALDGEIHQVNLAGAKLLGMERGALIKRRFEAFVLAKSRTTFHAFLDKVFANGSKETCEVALQRKGADPAWAHIEAISEDGQECRAVAVDISERKWVGEALRQSEEKYRSIIANMQEGFFELDLAGNFTFVNNALCRLIGYSREELIGKNNRQYADEETAKKTYQAFNRIYRTGEPIKRIEEKYIRKDGINGFAELSVSLIVDAEGKPIGFRGISHDITERKQAESQKEAVLEKLRKSEERHRMVVENAKEAIIIIQNAKVVFVNRAGIDMVGYSGNILTPKPFTDFIHPDDRNMIADQHIRRMKGEEVPSVYSFRILSQDGTVKWAELNSAVIQWNGGPAALIILNDITERKLAGEVLLHLSTHDTLTGLYNRGFFVEEMARLERGRQFPISIVSADVDHLKDTNDQHGHAAGDALIKRAAQVLTAAFRAEDVVARIGGDEFAVLLPSTDATAAEGSLRWLRQVIQENNAAHPKTPLCLSLGVSTAEKPIHLSGVLNKADANMYREKRERNAS